MSNFDLLNLIFIKLGVSPLFFGLYVFSFLLSIGACAHACTCMEDLVTKSKLGAGIRELVFKKIRILGGFKDEF